MALVPRVGKPLSHTEPFQLVVEEQVLLEITPLKVKSLILKVPFALLPPQAYILKVIEVEIF